MKRFKHVNARSLEEATSVLKEYGRKARALAGGTDLLGEMKDDILPEYPEVIVNIKTVPGLDYIRDDDRILRIGALTRLEDIARDKTVRKKYTLLAEAARRTASPHIREMGTIGGNICQSNRCWYYWVPDNRFYCLRKGGRECYALTGDGRYHSIFGATRVNGTPCSTECPANVDIPSYLSKIRDGNLLEAAQIIIESNPLPAITGRVCPHFCESNCNRGNFDEAVSIRCLERFLGDYILENSGEIYRPPQNETRKRVAIAGSGPAGLSAAYYLRRAGHSVTVFEGMAAPGGLLTYGIPPYRLPKDVVREQIKALEGTGIQLMLGAQIGRDRTLEDIRDSFDAVFLACGAWRERPSGTKGEPFLLSGAEFLRKANIGAKEVPGRKVGVIGGGNVAIDVARSLLRLGAEPVIIYRRRRDEMPALEEEVNKAEDEGIKIEFLTLPVEASQKDDRTVLKCTRMALGSPDETGRQRPIPVEGSEFTTEFDAVMKAIGEEPDISIIPGEFLDENGGLKIDGPTYSLGKNVFAGGDFVTGPSTVVAALAAGRKAASSIDRYLQGAEAPDAGEGSKHTNPAERFNSAYLRRTSRAEAPELPVAQRVKSMDVEEVGSLEPGVAESEANRCFNCGCVAVNSSDIAPALIALDARIKTTKQVIEAEKFFTVAGDKTTVLDDDEVVVETEIPLPDANARSKFIKFALRKSIDFPVVNCAAVIASERGVVRSARICLNSVYNQPYRAVKAEAHIIGKPIDESSAEDAADAVIMDALPLVNNGYKIQIARTLVKRAILACQVSER
jgi:NADPH-dependent glutamate synthase beta subunit-like oxidoreductase/CO/xanthine dehydrogenase FAD-binding subunit